MNKARVDLDDFFDLKVDKVFHLKNVYFGQLGFRNIQTEIFKFFAKNTCLDGISNI